MPFDPAQHTGRLPRLAPEFYRGKAWVHGTMTVENRGTGWLNDLHHARWREALVHALARHGVICPVYCVMPDHAHFLWTGVHVQSDQRLAARLFRTTWNRTLAAGGHSLQRQGYDHVLREKECERHAVQTVMTYILENPVRAGLAMEWRTWPYAGTLVPGYPELDPRDDDFWEKFWRIYETLAEGDRPAKA